MHAIQQLINVIEAGNRNVPEGSQLLRVVRSLGPNSVCIESRASLDLPFEQLCVSTTTCQGSCLPPEVALVPVDISSAEVLEPAPVVVEQVEESTRMEESTRTEDVENFSAPRSSKGKNR